MPEILFDASKKIILVKYAVYFGNIELTAPISLEFITRDSTSSYDVYLYNALDTIYTASHRTVPGRDNRHASLVPRVNGI